METYKKLFPLIYIYIFLSAVSYSLSRFTQLNLSFQILAIILTAALVISFVIGIIFFTGQKKQGTKNVAFTLVAVSLKFILYLVLLVILKLSLKNLSFDIILAFFVIYLSFTSYLLITFVKVLKTRISNDAKE